MKFETCLHQKVSAKGKKVAKWCKKKSIRLAHKKVITLLKKGENDKAEGVNTYPIQGWVW